MSFASPPQDWREPTTAEIEAAASQILRSEFGEMAHAGPENATRHPSYWRWTFDGADLENDKLHFLYDYWLRLRGDRAAPQAREVDPIDLKPAIGFVLLLDILDDGLDVRYRLYGSGVSDKAGRDWTGARLSEMNRIIRTDMALFYRAIYRAAFIRQEPLFTLHASPRWLSTESWRRLILPLTDASGTVSRFMVGNVPIGWRHLREEEIKAQRDRLFSADIARS